MSDGESSGPNQEQLDELEGEIEQARHHLREATHEDHRDHEFFEDDQSRPEEAPGNDNVPA